VFPVRYELNILMLFKINPSLKGLRDLIYIILSINVVLRHTETKIDVIFGVLCVCLAVCYIRSAFKLEDEHFKL
jgi:hypothetical protein